MITNPQVQKVLKRFKNSYTTDRRDYFSNEAKETV